MLKKIVIVLFVLCFYSCENSLGERNEREKIETEINYETEGGTVGNGSNGNKPGS